ncbi:MAG: YjjG family noncanonical pyrimidine nucleotidase [Actinomycetia bacterium]|nr:YjjG family noncanonical pyrimidine nucleotidase [Actinomycetes bacterium]
MKYTTLLFDLDHTLFDSAVAEAVAFDDTLRSAGAQDPSDYYPTFEAINTDLWSKVEQGVLSPNEVRHLRFEMLIDATDLTADPVEMGNRYVWGLGNNGELYEGAMEVLDTLATSATLALITNGIGEVQRTRIDRVGIEHFFDAIVISGEVGTAKPGTEIFDIAFEHLGTPDKATTLMIGDNLGSDIRGGINYAIDTCWYNPDLRSSGGVSMTHEITNLSALVELERTPHESD